MRLERSVATYRLACSEILLSINEKKLERSPEKGRTSYNLVDGLDGVTALAQLYALYSHAFWLVLTYDLLEDRRIDDITIKTFFRFILILYYIKQIDSKLPCVCSVIDHRTSKCGKNVEWIVSLQVPEF